MTKIRRNPSGKRKKRTLREILKLVQNGGESNRVLKNHYPTMTIETAEAEIRAQSKDIMDLAWEFIIDARGSWETGEGNRCLDLIEKYRKEE